MKEYRVKVTVRNNLILKAIEETGSKSVSEFCRNNALSESRVNALVAMRTRPITDDGEFCVSAKEIMEVLGACPTDLWTAEQLNLKLIKNSHEVHMDQSTLQAAICGEALPMLVEMPDEALSKSELSSVVDRLIKSKLTKREDSIIKMRFVSDMTLEDTARSVGCTRERIRQIEAKALRKMRLESTEKNALLCELTGE